MPTLCAVTLAAILVISPQVLLAECFDTCNGSCNCALTVSQIKRKRLSCCCACLERCGGWFTLAGASNSRPRYCSRKRGTSRIIVGAISQQALEMMRKRVQQLHHRLIVRGTSWREQEAHDDSCQADHTLQCAPE